MSYYLNSTARVLACGCNGKESSEMVKDGDTVRVHYTGSLGDGSVFDTSVGREPLELTIGKGEVIPGFEEAVKGLQVGQTDKVTISAKEAYGSYRDDLKLVVERSQLPENLEPVVGQQLQLQRKDGQAIRVVITDISEKTVTIDANHPLAGKDLTFEIQLVEVK
jgi:peptidylprolyl isomerase